ncbi:FMN-binding negative transcriptional regulator [Agreia sp. VKM Ac-1783]|uniref:FMN-binding negative transcriptional regulator n=1 Tax=Agreia sp. VKM Ac-1783 TaxID=1938889 RepID=UPI000A2ADCF1|nr:FMN-binding negative transcriptional regulator [Agreia sp. VKM Ac-1783]SMQ63062.1 negative transcriptional regulator, PaiB family [Agreia sp. VKM Ac-1783]
MRKTPAFVLSDEAELRRLIELNPWITLVSHTSKGLVASHYAVLLDDSRDELAIVGHVGRPDERLHELGQHEVMVIVQGPHGYISPSWYDAETAVPTWNFTSAHLSGVPEILDADENLRVLDRLVEHFEKHVDEPRLMRGTVENSDFADAISAGTVGFRLVPTRIEAKTKLSQNKPEATVDRIISELEGDGPYASEALAAEMRRVRGEK